MSISTRTADAARVFLAAVAAVSIQACAETPRDAGAAPASEVAPDSVPAPASVPAPGELATIADPSASDPAPAILAEPQATPGQIESLMSMLVGSWKATGSDPATGEAADYWMHIAPITLEGMENTLYVEQCRADDPLTPYHQGVLQAYSNRGKLRLRTLEFRAPEENGGVWAQLWTVPDLFPPIDPDGLIGTLDLEFRSSPVGFEGRSPHPYPNADDGAVEMVSELTVSQDRLVTSDRGYGPDGQVVWSSAGPATSEAVLNWNRSDPGFTVRREEDGLVVITLNDAPDGVQGVDGDTLQIDYALWLADGTLVDASQRRQQLMPVILPLTPERGLVEGFIRGIEGMNEGAIRKLIIPPAIGFGDAQRGPIPPGSTLYFRVEINTVQKPLEPPAPEGDAAGEAPEEGGSPGDAPDDGGH